MRPGRPTSRRWDLAVLMLALVGAAASQEEPRLCGACGRTVAPGAACCPEPCS